MKTLKEYAIEHRIQYRTAWNHFKAGKIEGAFKNRYGKVLIPEESLKVEYPFVMEEFLLHKINLTWKHKQID